MTGSERDVVMRSRNGCISNSDPPVRLIIRIGFRSYPWELRQLPIRVDFKLYICSVGYGKSQVIWSKVSFTLKINLFLSVCVCVKMLTLCL